MRRYLGLIPARGGSKSIPLKNIASCAGRPLLAWTCDAALASRKLTRIVLSTDDGRIADVGRACGIEVPFIRPTALSQDETPSIDVMVHAVRHLEETGAKFDAVVLLQPTSPLRTSAHIDGAIDLYEQGNADTVVSVVEVPHRFHPSSLMRLQDGVLIPFLNNGLTVTRRQELETLWARNGPAVLVTATHTLAWGSLYGGRTMSFPMSARESLDIDSDDDMAEAERLLAASNRV
jgi:CMP-N-acetylneuraminic acid synthetase